MSDIDTVAIRVFKHECPQAIVLVLKALDDSQAVLMADGVQRINVVDQEMRDIEFHGFVAGLQAQVQLAVMPLQDHESDGVPVFEDFCEPENLGVEVTGSDHVLHRNRRGDSAELDTVIGGIAYSMVSACKARSASSRCCMADALAVEVSRTVPTRSSVAQGNPVIGHQSTAAIRSISTGAFLGS